MLSNISNFINFLFYYSWFVQHLNPQIKYSASVWSKISFVGFHRTYDKQLHIITKLSVMSNVTNDMAFGIAVTPKSKIKTLLLCWIKRIRRKNRKLTIWDDAFRDRQRERESFLQLGRPRISSCVHWQLRVTYLFLISTKVVFFNLKLKPWCSYGQKLIQK